MVKQATVHCLFCIIVNRGTSHSRKIENGHDPFRTTRRRQEMKAPMDYIGLPREAFHGRPFETCPEGVFPARGKSAGRKLVRTPQYFTQIPWLGLCRGREGTQIDTGLFLDKGAKDISGVVAHARHGARHQTTQICRYRK